VIEPSPKRLVEQQDPVAALLQRAAEQYAEGLDANRALQRLQTKHRTTAPRGSWLLASSALVAVLALLVLVAWPQRGAAGGALTAEQLGRKASVSSALVGLAVPQPSVVAPPPPPAPRPSPREPVRADSRRSAPVPLTSAAAAPSMLPTEPDCSAVARSGDAKAAAACFAERAAGFGLSAQVALYELSRLERDALGKPAQALATLERYLERFPSGSLNGEVRFSRIELLVRLGRAQEALDASRDFLSSSFGVERAAEVHLLRGNLLLRRQQGAAASVEYRAALNAPGRVGDDAAYQLAVALEQSADRQRSRLAYERYLERPGARHAAAAKARLVELAK
jgi:hypothetical protein